MKTQNLMMCALGAILFADGALAACKFKEDTNDFFSGVPTLRTAWTAVNPGACEGDCNARGSLSIVKESGKQWVEFDASFSRSFVFVPTQAELNDAFIVPQGAKLAITLADGALIELPIIEPVDGSTNIKYPYSNNNDNYVLNAWARLRFELSESDLQVLASQKSTLVRLVGIDRQLVIPVPKKQQTFMEAAKCQQKGSSK